MQPAPARETVRFGPFELNLRAKELRKQGRLVRLPDKPYQRLTLLVDAETYGMYEAAARERLRGRDEDDWPALATALALNCAIWTEDTDFFGAGVAVWTTDRVELFLRRQQPS